MNKDIFCKLHKDYVAWPLNYKIYHYDLIHIIPHPAFFFSLVLKKNQYYTIISLIIYDL